MSTRKDDLSIQASINDSGYLVMRAIGKQAAFVYIADGEMYRTCPQCYGKTPVDYVICRHCECGFYEVG